MSSSADGDGDLVPGRVSIFWTAQGNVAEGLGVI
jgi:hypothetical protein